MAEFRMPSLGADMDRGTVVEWRVAPGDVVHRGDIVAVVDTEKSTIEVEVFDDGVVEELLVPVGKEVDVGTPLARIGTGAPRPAAAPADELAAPETPVAPEPRVETSPPPKRAAAGRTASPLVRHLAEEAHLDLAAVTGTGPGGAVTRADVEQAASRAEAPVGPTRMSPRARRLAAEHDLDLTGATGTGPGGAVVAADVEARLRTETPGDERTAMLRRSVAALMARSKREIPHYYLATTIDLGPATAWMTDRNADRPVQRRLVAAALLARATALAAAAVPVVNGHLVDDRFVAADTVDLGIAVSRRGGGLVAPVLRGAEGLDLDALMDRLRDLVTRARAGTLRSSEMTDPSITVTNLGEQGVEAVYGVIYPPQVALVGFGRVVERPWAVDGMLTVRPVVTATLSADHRVSDGHDGARFLDLVDQHLQHPERL